jgi:hypothetical protein
MRIALLVLVALALSASMAMAAVSQADGWAGTPLAGSGGKIGNPATNWYQAGGDYSNVVIWDHDDSKWMVVSATEWPIPNLEITADIELRVEESGQSELYFHIGDTAAGVPSGFLRWGLSQNHPCWIGITKSTWDANDGLPGGDATVLKFVNDGSFGRTGLLAGDISDGKIPFTVSFIQDTNPAVASAYTSGVGGWGYWSPERVPACDHSGYWKIDIQPEYHEADGHYALDPVMVVAPGL